MPRYDDLKANLNKKTIFCSHLGFGEQGAVLAQLNKAIYITTSTELARKMQAQLESLNKKCVVVDDFDKPFTLSTFESNEHKIDLLNGGYPLCQMAGRVFFYCSAKMRTLIKKEKSGCK